LKECIISGLLSVNGYKVLHLDRNPYYGGESASLNLAQVFEYFKLQAPSGEDYGPLGFIRDYNIDLIPKFIMSSGILVNMLVKADVTKYLEFRQVEGSFVVKDKKIHKVPATDAEAVGSALLGLMEKQRAKKFFVFVQEYDPDNPKTHKGFDLKTATMRQVFHKFKLEENTIDFLGHALALYRDDQYLDQPALPTIERVRQYCESLSRYGKSPFIYPLYGLGELPQAFARLSAIYGGTYMLNVPITEILYENGVAIGVKSGNDIAKAKFLVGDPTYFPQKVKKIGQVVRGIAILDHPVNGTHGAGSLQIVIPQKQVPPRKSDIYISVVSHSHEVAPKGKFIAIVSTTVETNDPIKELDPAFDLLGARLKTFEKVHGIYEPTDDGTKDKVFVTTSYDATSHFETTALDVLDVWRRITGKELDLEEKPASSSSS